ncbi:hypothetical protein Agub_g7183, partial [Astrephomene gubernaculifera]
MKRLTTGTLLESHLHALQLTSGAASGAAVVEVLPPFPTDELKPTLKCKYKDVKELLAATFPKNRVEIHDSVYGGRNGGSGNYSYRACLAAGVWVRHGEGRGRILCAALLRLNLKLDAARTAEASRTHVQLLYLATRPDCRHRGLARLLLRHILRAAAAQGHQYASVVVGGRDVQAYWCRMGFSAGPEGWQEPPGGVRRARAGETEAVRAVVAASRQHQPHSAIWVTPLQPEPGGMTWEERVAAAEAQVKLSTPAAPAAEAAAAAAEAAAAGGAASVKPAAAVQGASAAAQGAPGGVTAAMEVGEAEAAAAAAAGAAAVAATAAGAPPAEELPERSFVYNRGSSDEEEDEEEVEEGGGKEQQSVIASAAAGAAAQLPSQAPHTSPTVRPPARPGPNPYGDMFGSDDDGEGEEQVDDDGEGEEQVDDEQREASSGRQGRWERVCVQEQLGQAELRGQQPQREQREEGSEQDQGTAEEEAISSFTHVDSGGELERGRGAEGGTGAE